jgi:hypothetical protein
LPFRRVTFARASQIRKAEQTRSGLDRMSMRPAAGSITSFFGATCGATAGRPQQFGADADGQGLAHSIREPTFDRGGST